MAARGLHDWPEAVLVTPSLGNGEAAHAGGAVSSFCSLFSIRRVQVMGVTAWRPMLCEYTN